MNSVLNCNSCPYTDKNCGAHAQCSKCIETEGAAPAAPTENK